MIYLILHNIRSLHNVGSIFRTADAMGVKKIFLTGYTPDPSTKTALGAEKYVEKERLKSPQNLIKKLKSENFLIVSLEQMQNSISINKFSRKKLKKIVLIFGNEVRGVSKSILSLSDAVVEIPMRGVMVRQAHHPRHTRRGKESLNVSVAAGIALYVINNQIS